MGGVGENNNDKGEADSVSQLTNWLKTQEHLPQFIDELLLQKFINACKDDIEKAKKLIDLNYTMRNNYPQVFLKRDPCDEGTKNILEAIDMLILPGVTKDGSKVLLYRLVDYDPEKYVFPDVIKLFFMMADARFATPDPVGLSSGEMPIFDMKGFSLKHLTKVTLSLLRIYMRFTQEAHPIQLKSIHVINCPSFLDKVLTVIKPFIKSEVFKMIHFHLPGSATLDEFVPKEMLPNEMGGSAGHVADIKNQWIEVLREKRDYLTNEKYWKVDESKRKKTKAEIEARESFKSLSID